VDIEGNMDDGHVHVEKQHCRFYEQEFPKIDEVVMVEVRGTPSRASPPDSRGEKGPDPSPRTGRAAPLPGFSRTLHPRCLAREISCLAVASTITGVEQLPPCWSPGDSRAESPRGDPAGSLLPETPRTVELARSVPLGAAHRSRGSLPVALAGRDGSRALSPRPAPLWRPAPAPALLQPPPPSPRVRPCSRTVFQRRYGLAPPSRCCATPSPAHPPRPPGLLGRRPIPASPPPPPPRRSRRSLRWVLTCRCWSTTTKRA